MKELIKGIGAAIGGLVMVLAIIGVQLFVAGGFMCLAVWVFLKVIGKI